MGVVHSVRVFHWLLLFKFLLDLTGCIDEKVSSCSRFSNVLVSLRLQPSLIVTRFNSNGR